MFIEIHPDFFRETDNFELQFKRFSFKRFLSGPRDKIQNRSRKFSTITLIEKNRMMISEMIMTQYLQKVWAVLEISIYHRTALFKIY